MCSSVELEEILNFGKVNIYTANTGNHVEQGDPNIYTVAPMSLNLCKICTNMQLGEVVNPHFLYKNFKYKTQITKGLNEHFKTLTSELISKLRFKPKDNILDIGSNDGTFLSSLKVLQILLAWSLVKKFLIMLISVVLILLMHISTRSSQKKLKKNMAHLI